MNRVVIVVDNDRIWTLPVWAKVLPELIQNGMNITGFWVCPGKLGSKSGIQIQSWYLRVFGLMSFSKLALIALLRMSMNLLSSIGGRGFLSFDGLAKKYSVPIYYSNSPNSDELKSWLSHNEVDIMIIMTSHVLKPQVLAEPRVGIINKHAALLPSYKGLFPYIWARIDSSRQGVSFHSVDEQIDSGRLLFQSVVGKEHCGSLIQFYDHVMENYCEQLLEAIAAMKDGDEIRSVRETSSYYGLPRREDMRNFYRMGGKIVNAGDIFRQLRVPLYK